ncbi:MAG: hypothetical protein ACR5LD_02705 [Symbiopectobacterium sp.]
MDDLLQRIHQLSTIINEIDTASREQSTGIEQVNIAVGGADWSGNAKSTD